MKMENISLVMRLACHTTFHFSILIFISHGGACAIMKWPHEFTAHGCKESFDESDHKVSGSPGQSFGDLAKVITRCLAVRFDESDHAVSGSPGQSFGESDHTAVMKLSPDIVFIQPDAGSFPVALSAQRPGPGYFSAIPFGKDTLLSRRALDTLLLQHGGGECFRDRHHRPEGHRDACAEAAGRAGGGEAEAEAGQDD